MEREKFMQEARLTAHRILEGKENGIMNLVQRAWAEGKRNAEVETLRAAIDEALDRREPKEEPKEDAVYPTWCEWLKKFGIISFEPDFHSLLSAYPTRTNSVKAYINEEGGKPIPAEIAQKLDIAPKEVQHGQ